METVLNKINSKKSLNKVKLFSIETIIEHEEKIVYHNVGFAQRVSKNIGLIAEESKSKISETDRDVLEMAVWLYTALLGGVASDDKDEAESIRFYIDYVNESYPKILKSFEVDGKDIPIIIEIVKSGLVTTKMQDKWQGVFVDALMMDFKGKNAKDRIIQFYEETILSDTNLSISKFYSLIIGYLSNYEPYTEYATDHIQPSIQRLIDNLEIEKKKISKKKSALIKKQLEINDVEFKEIKKSLNTVKGRDPRGIQTLFRTTSKNHYTLNEMVDRKANIMITVNAIILSLALSDLLGDKVYADIPIVIPMVILSTASLFSIIFAVLSITPSRTQGTFTETDVKNKRSNLLYYGNFRKMKFEDYERGMHDKLNDSDFLYNSMIKDLYYLGKTLDHKYNFIRLSLTIFLIGLVSAFIVSTLYRVVMTF